MTPEEQISDISLRKLKGALALLPFPRPKAVILAADTEVVFNNVLVGKPSSVEEAIQTLGRLSGRSHWVITSVSLFETTNQSLVQILDRTIVKFENLTDIEIEKYAQTGDPLDKAGSYGIQNIPKKFIHSIEGSLTNVIGLPMEKIKDFFKKQNWVFE